MSVMVARVPSARGSSAWIPVTRAPGLADTQVNPRFSSSSVTRQIAAGSFGWRTQARSPIAKGPGASFWIFVMLAVHSDQRSISLQMDQTVFGGAWISMLWVNFIRSKINEAKKSDGETACNGTY